LNKASISKKVVLTVLGFGVILAVILAAVYFLNRSHETIVNQQVQKPPVVSNTEDIKETTPQREEISLKGTFALPFKIKDIDELNGEINPFSIVRFSKDQADVGHPGIDIPLTKGASVFAVADGEIVIIETAGDPWGGQKIVQLIQKTVSDIQIRKLDITSINSGLLDYFQKNKEYPEKLEILTPDYLTVIPLDPVSKIPYSYIPNEDFTQYELVAKLSGDSEYSVKSN